MKIDDVRAARAVREAIGSDGALMIDAYDAVANAFGVRYNPHAWGTGVALAAALQLLAVLPHNPPGLVPTEPLLGFDRTEHRGRQAILTEPIEHERGGGAGGGGAGLGIEIDREALERLRVR